MHKAALRWVALNRLSGGGGGGAGGKADYVLITFILSPIRLCNTIMILSLPSPY